MKYFLAIASLSLTLSVQAVADEAGMAKAGDIMVHDSWARASIGNAPNSAAYMTLMNHGEVADKLIAVETALARAAELHNHIMEDGIAKMRRVEAIDVNPSEPASLEPGSLHVMLMGLTEKLEAGGVLPLTLTFENAGEVTLEVPIIGLRDAKKRGGGHKHGG